MLRICFFLNKNVNNLFFLLIRMLISVLALTVSPPVFADRLFRTVGRLIKAPALMSGWIGVSCKQISSVFQVDFKWIGLSCMWISINSSTFGLLDHVEPFAGP